MDYIVAGMVSMLRTGDANPDMTLEDLLRVTEESDLGEYDVDEELETLWERAKAQFVLRK